MRLRHLGALFTCCSCVSVLNAAPIAAQEVATPTLTSNWWLALGAGQGSTTRSAGVGAVVASAWYSKGVLVGGIRTADVSPILSDDHSQDFALLVGLRTPPNFAAIIGTVGYSMMSEQCDYSSCPAGYSSSDGESSFAYSLQARLNFNHFGVGVELLGANGSGRNHFSAAVVCLQVGSFKH